MTLKEPLRTLKKNALPDIELALLEAAQIAFIQDKKKDLICNGKTPVTIKTLHGRITFRTFAWSCASLIV